MPTTTLVKITNTPGAGRPNRLRVRIEGKDDRIVSLPAAGAVLGSDPTCDVAIDDSAVSRRHATIAPADRGFVVKDLGSRNGTWVDGLAVTELRAPPGTAVRLGRAVVELLPSEEDVEVQPSRSTSFGELRGASEAMRRVYAVLERASASDVPVLLLGESGTGKELAARAVHAQSPRARGPFVVFDCGAASESLVESELFGHKKGAFTGAHSERQGAFALAHKGTLFLDEIGDLPLALQPKLLRLLERGEVTPLGAKKSEHYDVRFVAATHRNLETMAEDQSFRADLFYRLAVVEVHLPSLRERRQDVPELVRWFLRSRGAPDVGVEGPSLERLVRHGWPGNVRELKNVVARAVALAEPGAPFPRMSFKLRGGASEPESASALGDLGRPYHDAKEELLLRFDRAYLVELLRRAGDNLSEAARIAGLERKHLYKVLERAGIDPRAAPSDD